MTNLVMVALVIDCLLVMEGDGTNGDAVGPLQIKSGLVADINRVRRAKGHREWKLSQRENRAESIVMAMEYMMLYEKPDWGPDEYYMLWRLGPTGMKRELDIPAKLDLALFRNLYAAKSKEKK